MGTYIDYIDGDDTCEAYVALPSGTGPHPAVLVAHQWSGQSDHERASADKLAALGYVGIAIDVYGKGNRGAPDATDHSALMMPWASNRAALKQRLMAAVEFAKGHEAVDSTKIAIMGYCFGGLCALDVARSGTTDVKGAISIHGVFGAPDIGPQADIATKVLILHGWEDPMATPANVERVAKELTDAKADWQLHAYGNAMHAFTAVHANMPERGMQYNANADRRSWAATVAFLEEIFA
ncbi:MAG: dienelactone hydrolase family protein [Sphingomonadales bacterium]